MSDSPSGDLHETASADGPGILAGLPRTRPQRASARRVASRAASTPSAASTTSSRQASAPSSQPMSKRTATTKRTTGKQRTTAMIRATGKASAPARKNASAEERAPRQGFEAEPDSLRPVQPPGSTELVSSAAELAGELAKAGVTAGARVLRDFLSRLPS